MAIGALVAIAIALMPARGVAKPDPNLERAKALYSKGDGLYKAKNYAGALDAFEQAYGAKPLPGLLFNIGQCHRMLGNLEAGIAKMSEFLDLATDADPSRRRVARDLITDMTRKLAQAREEEQKRNNKKNGDIVIVPDTDTAGGEEPFYKKWPFWVGTAVVVVAAAGTTAYFLTRDPDVPGSDLGNFDLSLVRW